MKRIEKKFKRLSVLQITYDKPQKSHPQGKNKRDVCRPFTPKLSTFGLTMKKAKSNPIKPQESISDKSISVS